MSQDDVVGLAESLLSREAWIEIMLVSTAMMEPSVASLARSVD